MKVLYILYQLFHSTSHFAGINHTYSNSYHYWFMDRQSAIFWGYYPGKIWSQLFCYVLLIPVKVVGHPEVLKKTSYVFSSQSSRVFRYLPDLWFSGTKL